MGRGLSEVTARPYENNTYCAINDRALDSGWSLSRTTIRGRNDSHNKMHAMYFVYIMASERNGTLYIGMTNDIARRAYEHREGLIDGFSKKYNVKRLVYFEPHDDIEAAIRREKEIKE